MLYDTRLFLESLSIVSSGATFCPLARADGEETGTNRCGGRRARMHRDVLPHVLSTSLSMLLKA